MALVICAFSGCVEEEAVTPIQTPIPRVENTPTPTPTPTIPPRTISELSELGYLAKASELLGKRVEIMKRSSNAIDDYADGKISLETAKYTQITCTEEMYEVANEVASLKPPTKYEEHHRHFLKSTNLQYSSMFEFNLYFEDGDISHIEKSRNLLEESQRELNLATIPT